jgi:hypothetical protein
MDRIRVLRAEPISSILSDDRVLLDGNMNHNRTGTGEDHDNKSHPSTSSSSIHSISHWNTLLSLLLVNSLGSLALIRIPWMISRIGWLLALPIILICCLTSLITIASVSRCSIVSGGNVNIYFQLHKYLGPYIGISLGLVFYVGQALAVAMYALAAGEVLAWSPKGKEATLNSIRLEKEVYSLVICFTAAIFLALRTYRFMRILSVLTASILLVTFLSVIVGVINSGHGHNYQAQNILLTGQHYQNFSHVLSVYLTLTSVSYTQISSAVLPISSSYFYHSATVALLSITFISIFLAILIAIFISRDVLLSEDLIVIVIAWPWQRCVQIGLIIGCYFAALHRLMNASRLLSAIAFRGGWTGTGSSKSYHIILAIRRFLSTKLIEEDHVISNTTNGSSAVGASDVEVAASNPMAMNMLQSSWNYDNYLQSSSNRTQQQEEYAVADNLFPININALFITWFMASIPCFAGNLNNLTATISCCYLLTFSFINAIAYIITRNRIISSISQDSASIDKSSSIEKLNSSFSFIDRVLNDRRFLKITPFLGSCCCIFLMLVVSVWLSALLIIITLAMVIYLSRSNDIRDPHSSTSRWGDGIETLLDEVIKTSLLILNSSQYYSRGITSDWRPQYLVILAHPIDEEEEKNPRAGDDENLVRLACQMKRPSDLIQVLYLAEDDSLTSSSSPQRSRSSTMTTGLNYSSSSPNLIAHLLPLIKGHGFAKSVFVPDLSKATMNAVIELAGSIGAMSPNAVMLAWPKDLDALSNEQIELQCDWYKAVIEAKKTLVVVKGDLLSKIRPRLGILGSSKSEAQSQEVDTIDIWWVVHDGGLLLLLPTLLQVYHQEKWQGSQLRLFVVMTKLQDNPMKFRRRAINFLRRVRVQAVVEVIDLASVAGEATWIYEQTISLANRLQFLNRVSRMSSTMTLAVQDLNESSADDEYEASRETRPPESAHPPHVADIFNIPRSSSIAHAAEQQHEHQPRPGVLATLFTPEYASHHPSSQQRNRLYASSSSSLSASGSSSSLAKRYQNCLPSRISATALASASIPINQEMLEEGVGTNSDLLIEEESMKMALKYNCDITRIKVCLTL